MIYFLCTILSEVTIWKMWFIEAFYLVKNSNAYKKCSCVFFQKGRLFTVTPTRGSVTKTVPYIEDKIHLSQTPTKRNITIFKRVSNLSKSMKHFPLKQWDFYTSFNTPSRLYVVTVVK